jgi:hypothetical protein
MDRLQTYIHGWEYNFQSSNLYLFYLDIPSIHIGWQAFGMVEDKLWG